METIYGTYVSCKFFDAENNKSVFMICPEPGSCMKYRLKNGLVKVVGKFCLQQEGLPAEYTGVWKDSDDYGYEFLMEKAVLTSRRTEDSKRLIQKMNIAVSQVVLQKIFKVMGPDIFQISPGIEDRICEKTGADPVMVVNIIDAIRLIKQEYDLFLFMDRYGGTYTQTLKILKRYEDRSIEILRTNPYRAMQEVGIPLKVLDQIGLRNGVDEFSETRIQAILSWCVNRETSSGNVYITADEICKCVTRNKDYKDIPSTAVTAALADHPEIVADGEHPDIYYQKFLLRDEQSAAAEFARIMVSRRELPFHPEYIDQIERELGRPFGAQQREAFLLLQSTGIKLLVGDPGTGKTTTVNGMLRYLEMLWQDLYGRLPVFTLCAPSGRASQRMKETTGRNALTIHKLLEYQPYGDREYYKNANDPIEADVIVVDEVSMMGLSIFAKLAGAIKNGSLVLLVGDVNQLQSVDPGCVLQDVIASGNVDICRLTELFRQAQDSCININAKKIISGDFDLVTGADFALVKSEPETTVERMLAIVQQLIAEAGDADRVQVLSPVKKGSCGVRDGNKALQAMINPSKGKGVWHGYKNFRKDDRVIMMKNNYALNYFNGDVGKITNVTENIIDIAFPASDTQIKLPKELYGDMELAYNCTVHKSQGSEYDYLLIVLQEECKGMLDRNLFYTAVTRGKKKVVVLYEGDTLKTAISTERKAQRHSLLVDRIHREFQKYEEMQEPVQEEKAS